MRVCEKKMRDLILGRKTGVACGNTHVVARDGTVRVVLHATDIAVITFTPDGHGTVRFDDGGWDTCTTRSRIHAVAQLLGVASVCRRKGVQVWTDTGEPFCSDRVQEIQL